MTRMALAVSFALSFAALGAEPLLIFGGRQHDKFLGCLNCSESDPKSVWNDYSTFGFGNDFGVWSPFGQYADQFSTTSMCNEFATDPPIVVDRAGNAYGRLSLNEYFSGSVCGALGDERMCRVVRSTCALKQ